MYNNCECYPICFLFNQLISIKSNITVAGEGIERPLLSSGVVKFKLDQSSNLENYEIDETVLQGLYYFQDSLSIYIICKPIIHMNSKVIILIY